MLLKLFIRKIDAKLLKTIQNECVINQTMNNNDGIPRFKSKRSTVITKTVHFELLSWVGTWFKLLEDQKNTFLS